jgi:O-Antigen ligase
VLATVSSSAPPADPRVRAAATPVVSVRQLRRDPQFVVRPWPESRPNSLRSRGWRRRHIGLFLLIAAAAVPVQWGRSLPLLGYPSVLDLALIGALWSLFAGLAFTGRVVIAYPRLLVIVAIPAFVTALSMLWSQDLGSTMQTTLASLFGLVAYVYILREMHGMSVERIHRYIRWFVYLLLVPPILMLVGVPGFTPQERGISETSAEYVGYFSRLSHPFIGRSNNLASVLAFFVPILAYRALVARSRADGLAAITVVTAVVLTQSRGVLLALLVTGPLLVMSSPDLRRQAVRILGAIGISALIATALLIVLVQTNPATTEFFSTRFSATGIEERQRLLDEGVDRVAARPLAGYGGGISPLGDTESGGERAHNTYLQQAISFGVPLGVVVSASLLVIVPFLFTRRSPAGFVVGYAVMGQLVIFATESSYEGNVQRVLFYLSLGLGVAIVAAREEGGGDAQRTPAVVNLTGIQEHPR